MTAVRADVFVMRVLCHCPELGPGADAIRAVYFPGSHFVLLLTLLAHREEGVQTVRLFSGVTATLTLWTNRGNHGKLPLVLRMARGDIRAKGWLRNANRVTEPGELNQSHSFALGCNCWKTGLTSVTNSEQPSP